jgi:uncharacterized repeat protein (TIGR01451 family)
MASPSWRQWLKRKLPRPSTSPRPGPILRRRPLSFEQLEDRVTPATMSLTGGTLQYLAASTETNNLTVSYSAGKYTFHDTGATITAPTTTGWSGNGTTTVTVTTGAGGVGTVSSIAIDLSANSNNDTANIDSINAATTVTTGGGKNTVNVSSNAPTNTGNLAGIAAALTVTSTNGGSDKLVVSNFGATTGDSNVVVGASTITGFAPNTITYNTASGGAFSLVHLVGSNSPTLAEKFTVNDPNATTFQLDSNAGGDTAVIEATDSGSTSNINMGAGAATVTVSSDGSATGNLDSILGTLNINEGSGSGKTLNLIDAGSTTAKNVTVTNSSVTGLAPATINYKAVGGTFGNITLDGGSGGNTFSMTGAVSGGSYTINTGSGGDSITVSGTGAAAGLTVNGQGGADTLTVDFAPGNPAPAGGIFYHAGGQSGDTLNVSNVNAATVTNTFLPDSSGTPHLGTINVGGSVVNYDGVSPVSITGTMANLVVNLPSGDGDNQAVLEDNGSATDNISQVRSGNGSFETTQFTNPTSSLTVNASGDGETLTVGHLDPAFNPTNGLTFNGGPAANTTDTLVVDFSSGSNVIPTTGGITFSGTGNGGISFRSGYTATKVTDNYTDAHSGTINVDGKVVSYSGLSQTRGMSDPLAAATRTFTFSSTVSNNVTLGDDPFANNGISRISSTASSPTTDFANPTTSVTVNLGNAGDTITAGPLDVHNPPPPINLNGGTGSDTFNVTPSTASTFSVAGDLPDPPTLPGDTLNATLPSGSNPVLASTATPTGFTGSYTFLAGGYQPVSFSRIETLNPSTVTLTITKDDGKTTAVPGTTVTYTIVTTNTGSLGVSGVTISDLLPSSLPPSTAPGFTSDSYTSMATGGATGNTPSGSGTINDTVSMPAGSTITYQLTALINPSSLGTLSNTATITPPSGVMGSPDNSTDSDTLTPQADLAVILTGPSGPLTPGSNLAYTITLANNGPSAAQNVSLTDAVPLGTTFVSATQNSGPSFALSSPPAGGMGAVSGSIATLAAGASASFTLVVHVNATDASGSIISNTASVSSSTSDPTPANNSSTFNGSVLIIESNSPPMDPPPSVSVAFGPFGEVVALVSPTGTLTQFDAFGAHVLGGGVRSASVAFSAIGEELLLTYQTGALALFDAAGVHVLGTSGVLSASIAFGPQGVVMEVVTLDGTLRQFDAFGVHVLGGGVSFASVALTPGGSEVLLITFQNGQLFQFDAAGAHLLGGPVLTAAATFTPTGAEVADVIYLDGSLFQFDTAGVHFLGKVF